jgi:hypothetical protein
LWIPRFLLIEKAQLISAGQEVFEVSGIDYDEGYKLAAGDEDREAEWKDEVQKVGPKEIGDGVDPDN